MRRERSIRSVPGGASAVLAALLCLGHPAQAGIETDAVATEVIVGMDEEGDPINPPTAPTWVVGTMGPWNGKAARYNEARDLLAFETVREDIRGASFLRAEKTDDTSRQSDNPLSYFIFDASIDPETDQTTLKSLFPFFEEGGDPENVETYGNAPTSVIFITDKDGDNGLCIGCWDVVATNTAGGVRILKADPKSGTSATGTDFTVMPTGTTIYARQNKDLAAWHPEGDWIIAAVEMPVHAGLHRAGTGEIGMFTNIYAIYVGTQTEAGQPLFGKIWVQLTDWVSTWGSLYDNVSIIPYDSIDRLPGDSMDSPPGDGIDNQCPMGAQYAETDTQYPFAYFHCSEEDQRPPTSGVMRPTVSPGIVAGTSHQARIAWGARVGIASTVDDEDPETCDAVVAGLPGGGVQLLGMGRVDLYNLNKTTSPTYPSSLPDVPIILYYNDALGPFGPTEAHPDGLYTWAGIQYSDPPPQVGQWYEPFAFTFDNEKVLFASDSFLTYRTGAAYPPTDVNKATFYYMDVLERNYLGTTIRSITDYDSSSGAYDYLPNSSDLGAPYYTITQPWGYWEEPVTPVQWDGEDYYAIGSNANLLDEDHVGTPTNGFYDLGRHLETMGLDVILIKEDLSLAKEITNFNTGTSTQTYGGCYEGETPPDMVADLIVYPTAFSTEYGTLYMTSEPSGQGGENPGGTILKMDLGAALDNDLMD